MIDLGQQLLATTQTMLDKAHAGEWQAVETLQAERVGLLQQLDKALVTASAQALENPALRQTLETCKRLEASCRQLSETFQSSLTDEQQKVSRGKAMQKAYGVQKGR